MKRILFSAASFLLIVLLVGCFNKKPNSPDEEIRDVVRVFMHEPNHFSVLVRANGAKEGTFIDLHWISSTQYFFDVPAGQPMWVEKKDITQYPNGSATIGRIALHLHSPQDINGAGWDHGKFGRGSTQVVE